MAKKSNGLYQAADPAGQANPSPPVRPGAGAEQGVNIMEFCKAFMRSTAGLWKKVFYRPQ